MVAKGQSVSWLSMTTPLVCFLVVFHFSVVVVKPGASAVWSVDEMLSEHTASRAAEAAGGPGVCYQVSCNSVVGEPMSTGCCLCARGASN